MSGLSFAWPRRVDEYWIATVRCGGDVHGLRLREQTVTLLDHEDAEAELTLLALGGRDASPCGAVARVWLGSATTLPVMALRAIPLRATIGVLTVGRYERREVFGRQVVRRLG